MAYNGTTEVASGLKPMGAGGYPIVDSADIRVTDEKRLDAKLAEMEEAIAAAAESGGGIPEPETAGTAGQVLKINGSGDPEWAAVSVGAADVSVAENKTLSTKLTEIDAALAEKLEASDVIPKPATAGTEGQHLQIDAQGNPVWANPGTPTDTQVGNAVSDWLDDHPDATTTVEDGAVSYAKLNSDLQGRLDGGSGTKSALAAQMCPAEWTPNLTIGSAFRFSDGKAGSGAVYARTTYLYYGYQKRSAINLNSNTYVCWVSYFDATAATTTTNGTGYLGCDSVEAGLHFIPKEAVWFGVTFTRVDEADLSASDLEAISAALQCYAATDTTLTTDGMAADARITGEKLSALWGYNFWAYGTITRNKAITSSGGTTGNDDYDATDFIPVTPGEIIYGYGGRYAFYDATKTFISGKTGVLGSAGTPMANGMRSVTVPEGAAYFRISTANANANNFYITKATGYEVELLSKTGNETSAAAGNLWDYGTVTNSAAINKSTGATTGDEDYKTTDYIPVLEGEIIYGNGGRYAFYDDTQTFIPGSSYVLSTTGAEMPNGMRYCTVPEGAAYFRICTLATSTSALYKGTILEAVTYGSVDSHPDYVKKSVYNNNLWRYGTPTYGAALNSSTGQTTANPDFDTTDYIPVNGGDIIYGYGSRYWFYDSEKEKMPGKTGNLFTGGEPVGNGMNYIAAPAGASYFRICASKTASAYQFLLYAASPFSSGKTGGGGRKLYCLGDSITRGMYAEAGASSSSGPTDYGYPYWIGQFTGYEVVNLGNSGSGWANVGSPETAGDPSTARNAKDVVDYYSFSDADIITMAWGVNDWKSTSTQNVALGDMSSESGDGTVIGNMKYCIETLATKRPTAQLIVLLPMNTNRKWSGMRDMTLAENWAFGYAYRNNQTLQDYRTAIRQCAEYYNVKVIDLEEVCPINRLNIRAVCGDGLHPTKAFHKQMGYALANLIC